jgi:hypothetical protein
MVGLWRDGRRRWAVVSLAIAILTLGSMAVSYWMGQAAQREWKASFRRNYMEKEGHGQRGALFEQYVLQLDTEKSFPSTMKQEELLDLLGPPDLWTGERDDVLYLYDYMSPTNGPSEVCISVRRGIAHSFYYCAKGVNDRTGWRSYRTDPPPNAPTPPSEK